MVKAKAPTAPQPTFAECLVEFWDEDIDRPNTATPVELEDYDVSRVVHDFIAKAKRWRQIQSDPTEAVAREEYAAHAARYLTGIFPNARVNVESFAAAAGEELGRFSADIVKLVAQRARRSQKTLPSISQLLEWAETEERRRNDQLHTYERDVAAHTRAINAGKAHAAEVVQHLKSACPEISLTVDELCSIHDGLIGCPMGIRPDYPRAREIHAKFVSLVERLMKGDPASVAFITRAAAALPPLLERMRIADDVSENGAGPEARDAAFNDWQSCWDEKGSLVSALLDELEVLLQPKPQPIAPKPPARRWHPELGMPRPGDRVSHTKFGEGTVTDVDQDRIDVSFSAYGFKRVLAAFLEAPAEPSPTQMVAAP